MFGDWDNELGNLKLFDRLDALIIKITPDKTA